MRAFIIPALATIALSILMTACAAGYKQRTTAVIAPCERPRTDLKGLGRVYTPVAQPSCQVAILPADLSSWIEAPLNSHKTRAQRRVVLGCANLTPDAEDCSYGGLLGHSVTAIANYDLSLYPETAIVKKAVLALHVRDNIPYFAKTVRIRARQMVGDTLQSVGEDVIEPFAQPGWIQFDVTEFVARGINERRPHVYFEIALPCGRDESELTTLSLLDNEPRLVVEFR